MGMEPCRAQAPDAPYAACMEAADAALRDGRFAAAEAACREALRLRPGDPAALERLGALALAQGGSDRAEAFFREALATAPQSVAACLGLGEALCGLGRLQEAGAAYACAASLDPSSAAALRGLGLTASGLGRHDEAVVLLGRAVRLHPEDAQAHFLLAEALRGLGRPREAAFCYGQALRLAPGHAAAMLHYGLALVADGRAREAVIWYERALQDNPGDVLLRNDLGHALRQTGRSEAAREQFALALAQRPDFVPARVNYAVACRDLGDNAAAEAACDEALAQAPDYPPALFTLGALRQDLRRHEEAIALFDRVLAHAPDNVPARWNKALSLLALGRLAEGFALYETGLGHKDLRGVPPDPSRRLTGRPRAGERLLLWAEQGFGDAIQFIRYAALCKACGAKIVVACPPALHRLFLRCPGVDAVCEDPAAAQYDRYVALMSLPHCFGTTLGDIPAAIPYLSVSEEARAAWATRLPCDGRPRVGLVWAGSPRGDMPETRLADRRRSLSLARLLPLLARDDVACVSLQMGEAAGQIRELGLEGRLADPMGGVRDFMDTAAIVAGLDLVVSVDTAVVHLAGALGRPVWVLSRFDACWRWLCNRETNPWYPGARVFGQPAPGDWDAVVARVAAELARFARERQ